MLIEFALSVWTLFLLTFLIFEFCMTVYTYSVLANAAREGVRYAIVHGSDSAVLQRPGFRMCGCLRQQRVGGGEELRHGYVPRHERDDRDPCLARWKSHAIQPGSG